MKFFSLALVAVLSSAVAPRSDWAEAAEPTTLAVATSSAMVVAANPMAVEAGLKVLRAGGSAVDAAVAVQSVLGLVEPQSSGLGGGAFMTYYDAATKEVIAYNGREKAPTGATGKWFYADDGKPLDRAAAVLSGRSTGVPGAIAMLSLAQSQHGKLAWKDLFSEAEHLAEAGFPVPDRMAAAASSRFPQATAPDVMAYFTKPDGTRVKAGDIMKNPDYAATLRKVAAEGPKALLDGPIAAAIVAKVHEPPNPSTMSLDDLKSYAPKITPGLCRPYRAYFVCTPPAPSGGPSLLEALGLLEHTAIDKHPNDIEGWYLFSQASRLMYADRDRYMGDPDFIDVPTAGLLDPAYLARRAKLIAATADPAAPAPGKPKGAGVRAPDHALEPGGTSHMVIVDAWGNVVSMTTTVESLFGSGRMVGGFFLNNELTDFSFAPDNHDGTPAANAVAAGKQPRSSMAPAIVLNREHRFVAAIGSPGGPSIVAYNLKTLVGLLDWKMPIQQAIELPNLISSGTVYAAEVERFTPEVAQGLAARGVKLSSGFAAEISGLHGVEVTPQGVRGGADPRREGVAKAP